MSSPAGPVSPVLVGRDDLLALADRRLAAAADGAGELLFLAGEAGIGKSRLLREIVRRASAAGFVVVSAGASPGDAEVAAGLLTDLATELRRNPMTAAAGELIVQRLGAAEDPGRQRRLLVGDLVLDFAEPVLITLEDLHWADDLTLEVLGRLGLRVRTLPILIIGTYRSDELYPHVPLRAQRARLLNQRHAEEARLSRLSSDDTAAMAAAIAGTALPVDVTGSVFARSDGIPLHVEEFLATVGEVPDTLADAVLIRAEQLTAPARALAGAASVLGRSFDVDLLTAITGDRPELLDEGLRELTERFFVQPHPDRSTYDFRHALIRDALYADLAPHRRRDLHARTAEAAVLAGFPAAFVSGQYERAHRPDIAHRYALVAADQAAAMSAHREAVELYRRAERTSTSASADLLTALAAELAAVDDNAAAAACYERAYRLRLELGDRLAAAALVPGWVAVRHLLGADLEDRVSALRAALPLTDGSAPEVLEVRFAIHAALAAAYMLDRRLSESISDGEIARSLIPPESAPAMRCDLDTTLASVLVFAGRMDEGWRLLEETVARAVAGRFEGSAARGYRMVGSSASVLVEYPRATRWLREGIEYAERAERFNDLHYMTAHLGHVLWATGDWAGARAEAVRALADGRGGITTRITALYVLGYVGLGVAAGSRSVLAEAAELGEGMHELQRVSPAWWGLAEAALLAGDLGAALAWCDKGYEASVRVRDAGYLFPYVVTGTRAFLGRHDPTGARGWLARTSELLVERRIPGTLGAIDHAWGLIHLHDGQTGKARVALAKADAFWSARQRFWEGTAVLVDQARCAARSRRPAAAAVLMARARAAYASVGIDVPDFGPASPGTISGREPAGGRLSARELEVARLVATGATNREIAGALTIAPKTVAAHVEHILAKLGVSRRAQIAAWVVTEVEHSS